MKKKRTIILICSICLITVICIGVWMVLHCLLDIKPDTDLSVESLRWTMIGSIGSWTGSMFGAIALIISLFALWLPQRVKIRVSFSAGFMLSQIPGIDKIDTYVVTVKNVGMKPVTVTNIYLHFGDKRQGDIFIGMLNQNSLLQAFTPAFPKRLAEGEAFEYYLLRDKLNAALAHDEITAPIDTPLSIRIDEVISGSKYYKTKWTLKTFIDG